MKSKILVVFIIAFVFISTITVFLQSTFKQDADFIHYKQQSMDFTTKHYVVRTPIITCTPSPTPAPTYNPDTIFFDDFNEEELNQCYWNKLEREINYNNELQSYVKDNVFVEDNCLVLLAENEDNHYTSGLVNTKSKIEFQYGSVSIRMKYPEGKSFFPAIWMLPVDDKGFPEIDIMEVVGHRPDTLYFVYHYYKEEKQNFCANTKLKKYMDFHTYTLVWTPESLIWYVDNEQVHQVTRELPDEPMYLIINFAIGGLWPGDPDEHTVFPAKVLIDYVRIVPYEQLNIRRK